MHPDNEGYYDEMEDPKRLECAVCGGSVDDIYPNDHTIILKCKRCAKELERLAEIENDYDDLKEKFEELLKLYEAVSSNYTSLQDHLKCLITK